MVTCATDSLSHYAPVGVAGGSPGSPREGQRRAYESGFTLLELVIATMLLVIGLVAITRAFTRGLASTGESEAYMTATLLAREKLAEVEGTEELQNGTEAGDVAEPYEGYRWESDIGDEAEIEGMKRVRIAILWNRGPHDHRLEIDTCLYKPPPPEETETGTEEEQPEEAGQNPAGAGAPSGMPSFGTGAGGGFAVPGTGGGGGGFTVPGMGGGSTGDFAMPDFGAGGGP